MSTRSFWFGFSLFSFIAGGLLAYLFAIQIILFTTLILGLFGFGVLLATAWVGAREVDEA